MGRIIFISLLFFITVSSYGEIDTTLQLVKNKSINGSYSNFYADNLGNVYLISANNQVKKLNDNLDSVSVFNDMRRYGDIYSMDVNNPLKILVYYKDFATILVLDRFLNIRNTIDLRNVGILQAKAVTQSYDNNYWVFDELNSKLKKIDDNGNVLLESPDFRVLFSYEFIPQHIIDADGALYLYDNKKGWLIFDYYGAYKKHIDVTGWKDVKASKNALTGVDNDYVYSINPNTFSERKMSLGLPANIKIQRSYDKLYVLTRDGLIRYLIQ